MQTLRFPKAKCELEKIQQLKQLAVKTIKAWCKTRWGSGFKMIKRMIASRIAIDHYLCKHNYDDLILDDNMWKILCNMEGVLKNVHKVSQHLSQQNVPTIGLTARLIEVLLREHLSVEESDPSSEEGPCAEVVTYKQSLAKELRKRWTKLQQGLTSNILQMSVYLDPRSKDYMFIENDGERNKALKKARDLAEVYLEKQEADYQRIQLAAMSAGQVRTERSRKDDEMRQRIEDASILLGKAVNSELPVLGDTRTLEQELDCYHAQTPMKFSSGYQSA